MDTTAPTPTVIRLITPATCTQHVFESWRTPPDREEAPFRRCLVCGLREQRDER